ncbi:uncharacterized protein PSFLO_01440 [Pseudozyma flocculosa]|uniref:Uncharacterized protein n=1 Tax=Pseudozyma flocculosa TaxID=84751 RepID=A0A5C3EXX2_9BASI|nr:uncharacterized protein PSFLO_01440 [Pseudozyma flocculosa]
MVNANPLDPGTRPTTSCTSCYKRKKPCRPTAEPGAGCTCTGEAEEEDLPREHQEMPLKAHTYGRAAVVSKDGLPKLLWIGWKV